MNIFVKVEETLKKEIKTAVLHANLAEETEIPTIVLEKPKEKGAKKLRKIFSKVEEPLKKEIKTAVLHANLAEETEIPPIVLEKPKEKNHGDFAANIAMQLARIAKMAPRQIAEKIVDQI